jgi:hypothetical protein
MSKRGVVVSLLPKEALLKKRLRSHLQRLGFKKTRDGNLILPGDGKDVVRALHQGQRRERLARQKEFIAAAWPKLKTYFASGTDIDPAKIRPRLERVRSDTWQGDLFRLASLTWSVPVSNGFGRRMRYLVWDDSNGKLIGIFAIGDPVFNLAVRDKYLTWDGKMRASRLVDVMDAYVLGALPPYNRILGGKLVASLLRTRELYDDFAESYGETEGIISGAKKSAKLLAITTSSSMGRSSVYNRVKLGGVEYLKSLGYTGGWGHFHIPDNLFVELREYLREKDHRYADLHRFGEGPNWRLRTTRAALAALGFKEDILKHGIRREVFICELAGNTKKVLNGKAKKPDLSGLLTVEQVAELALKRWVIPRAARDQSYVAYKADEIYNLFAPPRIDLRKRANAE